MKQQKTLLKGKKEHAQVKKKSQSSRVLSNGDETKMPTIEIIQDTNTTAKEFESRMAKRWSIKML
jgi:hypothetical protein